MAVSDAAGTLHLEPPPETSRVRAYGLDVSCLSWPAVPGAKDAAHTLFLLHGFLDLSWGMAPLASALRAHGVGAKMIAPDWRGHGDSDWIGAGGYYHFVDYLLDLDALTRALAPTAVAGDGGAELWLLGHSMGGGAAALFAGAFPERVHALVFAEGYGPPAGDIEDAGSRLRLWVESVRAASPKREPSATKGMRSLDEAVERLRASNPRVPAATVRFLAEKSTRRGGDGLLRWKFDPLHRTPAAYPFIAAQAASTWRRVACPTLLVDGADSPMLALPDVGARQAAFANARRVVLEGRGHMMHLEGTDEMAREVAAFLGERLNPRVRPDASSE
jgi:pimeloyl-ACP methyl ester carboxylesterase